MANAQHKIYTNISFRAEVSDADYEDLEEYHSTEYDEAHSVQKKHPANDIHIKLPNTPPIKANIHGHQQIQISLWLLCLIIICSLLAIVLTGVVTFFITKYADETGCYWSTWSSWSKCSITCGNGLQVRMRQRTNYTMLCSNNESYDSKTCSSSACTGWGVPLHMKFSQTALYNKWFISADNTILSNVHTIDTFRSDDAQLQNYKGTIADICIGDKELIYYEVNYNYTIVTALIETRLVLEVGLAERSSVDRSFFVGSKSVTGWSFSLSRGSNIDIAYLKSIDADSHRVWESISNIIVVTKVHGKFKLFVNRRRNECSLRHRDSVYHVINNVKSSMKLCPVFAVYNPDLVHVKLQLMNPRNFTYYPW